MVDSVIDPNAAVHGLIESPKAASMTSEEPHTRLRRLVDDYFDAIYRAVKRFGAPTSLADDGVQQVFLVAASKLDSIEPASERAFLFGTAFRIAKELRRRVKDLPKTLEGEQALLSKADSSPDLEEIIDQKRARLLLDALLAEMPDELRAAFVLYEIEQLTVPEIAQALDIAAGTAASRLRRAREAFEQGIARHRAKEQFRAEHARSDAVKARKREGT